MTTTYENIRGVVSKPPAQRTHTEIEVLLSWFRKKSELFRSLDTDIVVDILRNCVFSTRQRDNIIIKQGEKGDCFYVILQGTVSIYINNLISDSIEDEDHTTGAGAADGQGSLYNDKGELDRTKFGNHVGDISHSEEQQKLNYPECYNDQGKLMRSYFGPFISQISSGNSFGELALINKNCIRNASIIADETTDLIVVYRDLYNRCLRAAQAAEFEERNSFVRNHPVFAAWQIKHKKQMAMSIRKEKVQFNEFICRQGENIDCMYYLVSGTATVLMDPAQHEAQYPQFYPLKDPKEIEAKEELMGNSDDHIHLRKVEKRSTTLDNLNAPLPVPPSALRKREKNKKSYEVSVVGTNECIGDTELMLDLKTFLQSVLCTQACMVYVLDLKNYERLIVKRNKTTLDLIRNIAEQKMQSRMRRLNQEHIPLLRTLLYKMQCIDKDKERARKAKEMLSTTSPTVSHSQPDILPHRGALIDMFGPGTVFFRNRQREQAKKKKGMFRGATTGGLGMSGQSANVEHNTEHAGYEQQNGHNGLGAGDVLDLEDDERNSPAMKSFRDWSTSDRALSVLEDRIAAWHTALNESPQQIVTSRCHPKLIKLRRVHVEDVKELKPGTTVLLRRKRPRAPKIMFGEEEDTTHDGTFATQTGDSVDSDTAYADVYTGGVSDAQESAAATTTLHGIHWPQLTGATFTASHHQRATSPSTSFVALGISGGGTILDMIKRQQDQEAADMHQLRSIVGGSKKRAQGNTLRLPGDDRMDSRVKYLKSREGFIQHENAIPSPLGYEIPQNKILPLLESNNKQSQYDNDREQKGEALQIPQLIVGNGLVTRSSNSNPNMVSEISRISTP